MRTKRMLAASLLAVVALVAQPAAATAQDGARTGAPGEVVDLQVSATSDRVTVSWGEPETGGAPTSYRVNLKPADGGPGKVKNPKAPKTSVTYSNLDAGETYRVWVRALNDEGKGPKVHYGGNIALLPSAQAPAEVQGGSGDPQPQQQVLDATIGRPAINLMHPIHNGFQVYWYAPQGLSDSVTGYDLQYREYDADSSTWGNWSDAGHTGTDTFLLLTGLKAETRYETRVRAWIGNRYSRWSLHRSSVNKAYTKNYQDYGRPDPPTVPTATAGAGTVTVSWTDPGTANNSVAITAYQVAWRSDSGTTHSSRLPATTTSYDIVGLAANTSYEVWVKAHAAAGSNNSPSVEVVTLNPPPTTTTTAPLQIDGTPAVEVPADPGEPGAPGAPTPDPLATATSGTITVSWTAASGTVGHYKVLVKECRASKRADVDCKPLRGKTKNVDASQTSVTFKKMQPGTTYNVWVRAINAYHKGPRLTGSVTTLAAPVFASAELDWSTRSYTVGQAEQLSIGPLPTATSEHGPLTYSVDGVNSCNRGNARDGDGCGSAHKYNKNGAPLVDWEAAGFSFDAATRTLTSNTGTNAPTAAKVIAATSQRTISKVYTYNGEVFTGPRYGERGFLNGQFVDLVVKHEERMVPRVSALPVTIPVWYTVTDADGITTRLTIRIEVNAAPMLAAVSDQSGKVGEAFSLQLPQAKGVDWDAHTLTGAVPGLTLNSSGLLSGTPTAPGTASLTWTADAAKGDDPSVSFDVVVSNADSGAPTAAPASVTASYTHVTSRVEVDYAAVAGATGYVVQVIPSDGSWPAFDVDHAPGKAHTASQRDGIVGVHLSHATNGSTKYTMLSDIATGLYKLRVAGRNANGVGPFTEVALNLSTDTLPAPTGLTATQTRTGHVYDNGGRGDVALDWDDVDYAAGYVVQVVWIWTSSHPGWPSSTSDYPTERRGTTITHNGSSATINDIGHGKHEVRVATRDNQGRIGPWSTPLAFTVAARSDP